MRCNRVLTVTVAVWLLVQMVMASSAGAEEPDAAADVSARAISVIATAIALPVKLVTCVATVAIGGAAYGLTMGGSERIRRELVAGTSSNCGGKYYVTPQEVRRFTREPGEGW